MFQSAVGPLFGTHFVDPLGARSLAHFFAPDARVLAANRTAEATSGENHLEPRRMEIKIISGHLFLLLISL